MPRRVEIERVCDLCGHWGLDKSGIFFKWRKLLVWACGCCRHEYGLGPEPPYRPAVVPISLKEKP